MCVGCHASVYCRLAAGWAGLKVTKRVRPGCAGAGGWCSGPGTVTPAWFPTCVITGTNRQTHDNMARHGALVIYQDIYLFMLSAKVQGLFY